MMFRCSFCIFLILLLLSVLHSKNYLVHRIQKPIPKLNFHKLYPKLVCFLQALDEHAYDWKLKHFTSSVPQILSLPSVTYDSTFGCDSTLTGIIVRKSDHEYHQKICLFKSMKKIADGLDCGEDDLHVVMCRGPFLHLEQVSI